MGSLESPSNNLDHQRAVACHFAAVLIETTEENKRWREKIGTTVRMTRGSLNDAAVEQLQESDESSNLLSHESIQHNGLDYNQNCDRIYLDMSEQSQHDKVSCPDVVNELQEYFGFLERGANILDENRLLKLHLPKQISVCMSYIFFFFTSPVGSSFFFNYLLVGVSAKLDCGDKLDVLQIIFIL